jgi:hypothetical protein
MSYVFCKLSLHENQKIFSHARDGVLPTSHRAGEIQPKQGTGSRLFLDIFFSPEIQQTAKEENEKAATDHC